MSVLLRRAILPRGFKAAGTACGLKKSGAVDLALFYSEYPAVSKALFTKNRVKAAPLLVNKEYLGKGGKFRAILANSGNANCFTGKPGLEDAREMSREAARVIAADPQQVFVASTGIIGKRLAVSKILCALPGLAGALTSGGVSSAQKAIMTTDQFPKGVTVRFQDRLRKFTVCGVAKGAGMIAPDMATMLCFLFTDAGVPAAALDRALREAVADSFNCITVDGCMSTNDNVIIMANGAAGDLTDFRAFNRAVSMVCSELALMIVKDAEGASKFVRIRVKDAFSRRQARQGALAIANSNLFKTAVYGENRNLGRVVAALGASGIKLDQGKLKVAVSSLKRRNITVDVCLGAGSYSAVVYTSDLSPEYIKINADYS